MNNKEKIDSYKIQYLNHLDMACALYESKKIDRKLFASQYTDTIVNIYKSEDYSYLLTGDDNSSHFPSLTKYYNKILKRN